MHHIIMLCPPTLQILENQSKVADKVDGDHLFVLESIQFLIQTLI